MGSSRRTGEYVGRRSLVGRALTRPGASRVRAYTRVFMKTAFAALLAAATCAAASPSFSQDSQRFDLVCPLREATTGQDAGIRHYSIDLTAMTACDNLRHACPSNPYHIHASPEMIIIAFDLGDQDGKGFTEQKVIRRQDGHYTEHTIEDGSSYSAEGTCTRAPFGSVPPAKF